jgi:hypothetical protein
MVRIWNLPVEILDDKHLLAEHLETHVAFSAIQRAGGPWYKHPQVQRFVGKLPQLKYRHDQQVSEMRRRGWNGHKTPLPDSIPAEPYAIKADDYLRDFKVLDSRHGLNSGQEIPEKFKYRIDWK